MILLKTSEELSVFAHNPEMNQPNDIGRVNSKIRNFKRFKKLSEPTKAIMDNDILFASDPNWANDTDGKLWRIEKGKHFHKMQVLSIWNLET